MSLGGPQSWSGHKCLCRGSNPDSPVVQAIARHHTDWATWLTWHSHWFSWNCVNSCIHTDVCNWMRVWYGRRNRPSRHYKSITELSIHTLWGIISFWMSCIGTSVPATPSRRAILVCATERNRYKIHYFGTKAYANCICWLQYSNNKQQTLIIHSDHYTRQYKK
jgi:hypothetical protein